MKVTEFCNVLKVAGERTEWKEKSQGGRKNVKLWKGRRKRENYQGNKTYHKVD